MPCLFYFMFCRPKHFNTGRYVGQFENKNDKIFIIFKNMYRTSMILQSQYLITQSSKKQVIKELRSYENNTVYKTFEGKVFTIREGNGYSWKTFRVTCLLMAIANPYGHGLTGTFMVEWTITKVFLLESFVVYGITLRTLQVDWRKNGVQVGLSQLCCFLLLV